MSIAGIHSNRGDAYQTLVAFDWALTVLSDPDFQWLEIDSLTYLVDDVVVGKADGTLIACQCKKNQPSFNTWTIANLADELDKAFDLLANNKNVQVRFYSRNNFGELGKLKEHRSTQNDEASYQVGLGKNLKLVDQALSKRLSTTDLKLSTFEFLSRTSFVTSDELDRMENLLRERLRNIASNADSAFTALWASLDQLGARISGNSASVATQHRLTKSDLKAILQQAGSTIVPPMNLAEIRDSFMSTSAIGRSWRRDIAGQRISSPSVDILLAAIDAKTRSILLTGLPGSGKTCVMLALQEALEVRAETNPSIVPLFIQSREFADLSASEDRQAQGLSEQWVEKAARLTEEAHVIVVIDSLDVLSIARDHRALQYFLAQTDRLLLIPNITVITSCRDFDRRYDRRIAERKWECEIICKPLDWDSEIVPLLETLGVATTNIDTCTRALIRNPRELALFVELAQQGGAFNVVTSQALAQRYLDTIVLANYALGDEAIRAIEATASIMLKSRSLVIPHQRFNASQDVKRKLCSLNVLQVTQDGSLTFGHQTLLDVLIISGAVRSGLTLNDFINGLPPVPFVRPSIRSFVAQLALGERREFRKQLRTVLTGSAAFHIRRLVAESFAEQVPQDEDWQLIRDLREKHRDVFQVIYALAIATEWHVFWLKFLVPALKNAHDTEGLLAHVHRIAHWSNEDCAGVLSFWMETLSLDWFDGNEAADRIGIYLSQIAIENVALFSPLLSRLLTMPRSDHSFLGRVIANCVTAGVVNDSVLWGYISNDITDKDLSQFRFDNKLRCQPHEFGDRHENFITQHMKQSVYFLDLTIGAIEHWSTVRNLHYTSPYKGYRHGFLSETSHDDMHNWRDINHADSLEILLDAVESATLHHAKTNSDWWLKNREGLCFNHEGALLYFAILACTASPESNIDLIGRMLCDKEILEFELSYELGTLIGSAFKLLAEPVQDAVMTNIINYMSKDVTNESISWVMEIQANLIISIPCYMRSPDAQAIVELIEKKVGILDRQPLIRSKSGMVRAPFSYEVFLGSSDSGILRLLAHYSGRSHKADRDDYLIGGEREVGCQLQEAASRHPTRLLGFLSAFWADISESFREDILTGVSKYLAHRHGKLLPNEGWQPIEDPQPEFLAGQILDELESHSEDWYQRRSTAKALEAIANVTVKTVDADRLISLAEEFVGLQEKNPFSGGTSELINQGINMAKGSVADALMILAINFSKQSSELPRLLVPTLRTFASDRHPAVRALVLRRLPYLQSNSPDLAWELLQLALQDENRLWQIAEQYLYYSYRNHFEAVEPLLARLHNEGTGKDLETWGRISALATMADNIDFSQLLESLSALDSTDAWRGAATVWTNAENIQWHRDQCLRGIHSGLNTANLHSLEVAEQVTRIFNDKAEAVSIPLELIKRCFSVFESDTNDNNKHHRLFGLHEWLNKMVKSDTEYTLAVTEIYITHIINKKRQLHDYNNSLTQLMTRLFADAEEKEESDNGVMLHRVVDIQDLLLSMGAHGIADWLKAAERP